MTTVTDPPPAVEPHPPSLAAARHRRWVLAVLWVVFALWVAALLTMYFATVYPQRHPTDGRPPVGVVPPAR
jgi:type VI protein secretion system component VasF